MANKRKIIKTFGEQQRRVKTLDEQQVHNNNNKKKNNEKMPLWCSKGNKIKLRSLALGSEENDKDR